MGPSEWLSAITRIRPNTKHVLKVSLDDTKHDYYKIGSYNQDKDIFIPDNGSFHKNFRLRYDYGKFYASKTFFEGNSKHRRILWGWVNESSSVEDDIEKGWPGAQVVLALHNYFIKF